MSLVSSPRIDGCIFKFIDQRNEYGVGQVIGPCKQTFNHHRPFKFDDNSELRMKFFSLFLFQVLSACLIRIPYRILDLFTGGSIQRGVFDAKHEYRIMRVENNKTGAKVHRFAMNFLLAKNIFISLIKDIIRIAAYPIAMLGLQLTAVLGLFLPLDARLIYSTIEDIASPDLRLYKHSEWHYMGLMTFYSAPCMQTQEANQRKNLFAIEGDSSNADKPKSLRLSLANNLERFAPYFGSSKKELSELVEKVKIVVKDLKKDTAAYDEAQIKLKECTELFEEVLTVKDLWLDKGAKGIDPSQIKIETLKEKLQQVAAI